MADKNTSLEVDAETPADPAPTPKKDPKPGSDPTKGEPPVLEKPVPADPAEAEKEVKPDDKQDPTEPPPPVLVDPTLDPSPKEAVKRPPVPKDPQTGKPQISIDYVRTLDHCNPIYSEGGPFDGWIGDVDKVIAVTDIPIFDRLWILCRDEVLGDKLMRELGLWAVLDLFMASSASKPLEEAVGLAEGLTQLFVAGKGKVKDPTLNAAVNRILALREAFRVEHPNIDGNTDTAPTPEELIDWGVLIAAGQLMTPVARSAGMDPVLTAEDTFQKASGDKARADFEVRFVQHVKDMQHE